MCVKTERLGLLLIGAGVGLLLSFALCGWFLRVLIAAILIVLGLLLLTVFALAAFAPGLFTGYGQKELFTKWLPISREHLLGTNAMGYDLSLIHI